MLVFMLVLILVLVSLIRLLTEGQITWFNRKPPYSLTSNYDTPSNAKGKHFGRWQDMLEFV
jgi:hypothetical protein